MLPFLELDNLDSQSFHLRLQTEKLTSCELIKVKILRTDMVFQKVDYYECNRGYASWIGVTGNNTYVTFTKNTISGDFIILSHSHIGYFQIKSTSCRLTCSINKKGSSWVDEKTLTPDVISFLPAQMKLERYVIDVVFLYHSSYMDNQKITTEELELWTEGEVSLFNLILRNSGFDNIYVKSKGLFEVEYENNKNTSAKDVFLSFFNREPIANDIIKKMEENKADVVHFFSGSSSGPAASVGMIRQIHHSFNLIIQTNPGPAGVLAHETGHLLGFHHDWGWENDEIKKHLKNNGHKISQSIGTIMSYADNKVPYYSNLNNHYPGTEFFMGSETQNVCEFAQKQHQDGMTVMEKCSLAFERKDFPSVKVNTDTFNPEDPDYPLFSRKEITYPFPEKYDLLSGMECYSPVGESVKVTNVGDDVDITTSGFYKPILKLEDDSQRINYINLYVLVEDSGINGVIISPLDSEEIYNLHNDTNIVPEFIKLGIVNLGPASLVRASFQNASLHGEFETLVEQEIPINSEQYLDIPQTPIARWRIIVKNDIDVEAKIIYAIINSVGSMTLTRS